MSNNEKQLEVGPNLLWSTLIICAAVILGLLIVHGASCTQANTKAEYDFRASRAQSLGDKAAIVEARER